jgi:thioesterase domain-containing protein
MASTSTSTDDKLTALQAILDSMPPARAMQIRVQGWHADRLRLHAPLAANVNDKACAFGGSLASIMTLAAWSQCWLQAHTADWSADIFVADSQIEYQKPLYEDLVAEAWLDAQSQWEDVIRNGKQKGRARAVLHARVMREDGESVCRMQARYALIATT